MPGFEHYLGLIALGIAVGAYGTLIGAGGGFVLMPVLLLLYPNQSADLLTSISLAVVFFNALSGSEAYALMKRIDYRSGLLFAGATIPGAVLGALNTSYVPRRLFDLIFGILLIAAAIFLTGRPRQSVTSCKASRFSQYCVARHLVDSHGTEYHYSFNYFLGMAISVVVGYVSSFLGIGGGYHSCSSAQLLSQFSGPHRHSHLAFRFSYHGVDGHFGSHCNWNLRSRRSSNDSVSHRCIDRSPDRRTLIGENPGEMDHSGTRDSSGCCGTEDFGDCLVVPRSQDRIQTKTQRNGQSYK
jgi:uncharacterized membrane protein YfcA